MDQFEWLYAESATRPKFISIAIHPYLSDVPHRIGHVPRAFEEIFSRPCVAAWGGAKIIDWYLAQ
jgi:allantoinase